MKIFNKLDRYLYDRDVKIIFKNNCIDIVNYIDIVDFNDKKVIVSTVEFNVVIDGFNLVISRLMDNEVLISGVVNNISLCYVT